MESSTIEVPLGDPPLGVYPTRGHVQAQLNKYQLVALRSARIGLISSGERLANGRPLASNADVVRWLLEQLAAKNTNEFLP
jgi:hypothetical protein